MDWPMAVPTHVHIAMADQPVDLNEVRYEHHLKHRGRANQLIFSIVWLVIAIFMYSRLARRLYRWWSRRRQHPHRYARISQNNKISLVNRFQLLYNAVALQPFPPIFGSAITTFSFSKIILLAIYLTTMILLLTFVDAPLISQHFLDDVAFRAAWLTLTQVPFVYLLSTKRGPLNLLAGLSHERLNWLHRWVGRTIFVSATTHVAIMKSSISAQDIFHSNDRGMAIVRYGIATYSLLVWIAISSVLPLRRWSHRLFYINHYISTFFFLVVAFQHVPAFARAPICLSLSILILDKLFTAYFFIRNNISIALPLRKYTSFRRGPARGRLVMGFPVHMSAPSILIQNLPAQTADMMTIVRIGSIPFSWKPGQHVRLYVPALGRWEMHPFTPATCSAAPAPPLPPRKDVDIENTIASAKQPRHTSEMLLLVKAKSGFTKRLSDHHRDWLSRPCPNATRSTDEGLTAYIDGPYGDAPEWHAYENLVLVASSTGVSFALAVLDWLEQMCLTGDSEQLQTKSVKTIWMVRHIDPAFEELVKRTTSRCATTLEDFGIGVDAEFHITCPDSEPKPDTMEYDAFAHLRPPMRKILSDRAPLRIRHPDEIYEEWEREAEMEASKWAEPWDNEYDTYDDKSEEDSTLIDDQESNEEGTWMEELDDNDDEDDPFSDEYAYSHPRDADPASQRIIPDEEARKCQCALIQHQRRKLHSRWLNSHAVTLHYGTRPDISRLVEHAAGVGGTMVAVCSNKHVAREVRRTVAGLSMQCVKGGMGNRIDLHVEGDG